MKRGDLTQSLRPNQVWETDFKGWFYTQDKERCDPLTVTDLFSRFLFTVQALPQATQGWMRMASELFCTLGGEFILTTPEDTEKHRGFARGSDDSSPFTSTCLSYSLHLNEGIKGWA